MDFSEWLRRSAKRCLSLSSQGLPETLHTRDLLGKELSPCVQANTAWKRALFVSATVVSEDRILFALANGVKTKEMSQEQARVLKILWPRGNRGFPPFHYTWVQLARRLENLSLMRTETFYGKSR